MRYKSLLTFLVLFLTVVALGCVDQTSSGNGKAVKPPISEATIEDMIPVENLPVGITYLGTHEETLGNLGVTATEAVYKNSDKDDFYVRVIAAESKDAAEQLVSDYKSQYRNLRYDPFEEVVLNNHSATQIKENTLKGGRRVFTYTYIWNNENYVFIVASNEPNKNSVVFELARAVGY
jgi:hypothetical protein